MMTALLCQAALSALGLGLPTILASGTAATPSAAVSQEIVTITTTMDLLTNTSSVVTVQPCKTMTVALSQDAASALGPGPSTTHANGTVPTLSADAPLVATIIMTTTIVLQTTLTAATAPHSETMIAPSTPHVPSALGLGLPTILVSGIAPTPSAAASPPQMIQTTQITMTTTILTLLTTSPPTNTASAAVKTWTHPFVDLNATTASCPGPTTTQTTGFQMPLPAGA